MVGELGSTFGKQECQRLYEYIYFVCIWPCCATCGILVSQPGMEPASPAVKVQSPNHWTIREGPMLSLLNDSIWKEPAAMLWGCPSCDMERALWWGAEASRQQPWEGAAKEEAPPALSEPSDDAVLAASVSEEILSQNIPDPWHSMNLHKTTNVCWQRSI